MNKKFLLIGNIKSLYITQYIENVLEPLGFQIYMQISKEEYTFEKDFIKTHKLEIIKKHELYESLLFKIPFFGRKLKSLFNIFEILKIGSFDYIHLHYVTLLDLITISIVKSKKTKIYASFWGSDLLRQSRKYLGFEKKFLKKYNHISNAALLLQKSFEKLFPTLKEKSEMIPFGVSLLSYIDNISLDSKECKSFYGFPQEKKIIAIGYNGIKEQQHDKVIYALQNLENKNKYYILLQLSYGNNDKQYNEKLINLLKNSGFEYKIVTDFLSMEDLAKLRIATDIFINAQTTDAFSNSVMECIYTKTLILNASWLHYPELDEYPLYVNEFKKFEEIPSLLEKNISDEHLLWNKNKIKEETTWKACREKWAKIYDIK